MKKLFNYTLLLVIVLFPLNVLAESGSNGAGNNASHIKDTGSNCGSSDVCRANFWGGVRITYVRADGTPVSDSYDFMSNAQAKNSNFQYNSLSGDKSKLSGGSSFSATSAGSIPSMSSLVSNFKSQCGSLGEKGGEQLSCKAQGYSSHTNLSFTQEQTWFNSLTKKGLTSSEYMGNIEALNKAIQTAYPSFNADALTQDMIDACSNGQDIFIQMEPLFTTWDGGKSGDNKFVLGTFRDQYQYYEKEGKAQRFVQKYNCSAWNFSSLMYYDSNDETSSFQGFATAGKNDKWTHPDEKNGTGAVMNWANNMKDFCEGCTFTNGEFKIDDKPIDASTYSGSSLYQYVLDPEGDVNCCGQVEEAIHKGDPNVSDELKENYDFYCDRIGDPCTKKEYPSLGETIYYCTDAKECDEDTYKEQCEPEEECEPDPGEPDDPENNCCPDEPIEPGKIEGDVNNCCTDGTTSEAHDYKLNDIFCNNDSLGVENYQYKCGAEYYNNDEVELESDYCRMYCTERISVEIPGPITATSGRYFELTTTSKGTKSSYIEGYRRCRIRIQYDSWEKDYYDTVKEQEEAYNSFQDNKAYQKLYEKAEKEVISGQKETSSISCSCSCSYTYTGTCGSGKNTYSCTKTATASASDSDTCDIEFNKYPFKEMFDIYPVKIDKDKRDACEDIYEAIEFKEKKSYKTEHDDWSAWEIDPSIAKCDQQTASMQKTVSAGGKCSCTLSCGRTTTEAERRREDVHTTRADYNAAADSDNASYNSAADIAKELEETIDKCDKYFTDYEGANAEENYTLDTTQQFSYTQIYMDEYEGLKLDEIFVEFEETPGCQTDPSVTTGASDEDGMQENQYSTNKYGTGEEKMTDFKNSTLEYQKTATGYKQYQDEMYPADKIFTTDGRYHATCSWDEGQNTLYTLVPSGAASETIEVENYTTHEQFHKVYLSTLEGTYETYWDLHGLGTPRRNSTEGRFDRYFRENGEMCSGDSPNELKTLACTFSSEHEIVLTGYCNGVATEPEDCDPYDEGFRLFNFKVVDPANLFPYESVNYSGTIGHNWFVDESGQNSMQAIQSTAAKGMTYAPDNLTYSFILSPTDMAHIKDYNATKVLDEYYNSLGGYNDFNLSCSLRDDCHDVATGGNTATCRDQCKSHFIEDLANGNVNVSGMNYPVTGWNNRNMDLTAVRRSYGWN